MKISENQRKSVVSVQSVVKVVKTEKNQILENKNRLILLKTVFSIK
jgi:hypothetical protein